MRPKKNHDKDLNRKRGLYFILGLVLILALIYIALEWKIEEDNGGYDIGTSARIEANVSSSVFGTRARLKFQKIYREPSN